VCFAVASPVAVTEANKQGREFLLEHHTKTLLPSLYKDKPEEKVSTNKLIN